jgi:hypothetical protein
VAANDSSGQLASCAGSFPGGVVSSDPLYGDALACGMEIIDLFDHVLDNILPRVIDLRACIAAWLSVKITVLGSTSEKASW